MSYEDGMLHHIDQQREKREELHQSIEHAFPQAEKILKDPTYGIQAPEFASIYGKETVMADMVRVKKAEAEFKKPLEVHEQNSEKIAKVLEAIMVTQGDASASDWFAGASILKTSRFDDYFNHTDLLAEWHTATNNPEVLALAVDVTFGATTIEKKLSRIRGDIDHENLGSIKYFKTKDKTFMGQRSNVPRVIIGAARPTVQELAGMWINRDGEQLKTHSIQKGLITEIHHQLHAMREYATRSGKKRAADAYDRSLSIVDRIAEAKRSLPLGNVAHDRVYSEILHKTDELFSR